MPTINLASLSSVHFQGTVTTTPTGQPANQSYFQFFPLTKYLSFLIPPLRGNITTTPTGQPAKLKSCQDYSAG